MGISIYKSSAGSGKTFQLVNKYLKKVISQPSNYKKILAITFTNKATEEMKQRILAELSDLATNKPSKHLPILLDELNLNEELIRKKAIDVLHRILHDYSSFSISTIDSFFQLLSKTLANELKLPVNFKIDLDVDNISKLVIDKFYSQAQTDEGIFEWLTQMLIEKIESDKNWIISNDLQESIKQLIYNSNVLKQVDTFNHKNLYDFIKTLKHEREEFINTIHSKVKQLKQLLDTNGFQIADFSNGDKGALGIIKKITQKLDLKDLNNTLNGNRFLSAIEDPLKLVAKNKKNNSLRDFAINVVHPILLEIHQHSSKNLKEFITANIILKKIYNAGVIGKLNETLRNFRDQNEIFLLSDTNRILFELIKDNDSNFIYEKSGNTYNHIFIDEFQDTSNEQWAILRPLVINSLSENHDVLIVGDAKQSIYRWRGGNMKLILEGIEYSLPQFKEQISYSNLDKNRRSLPSIVNFNNNFFICAKNVFNSLIKRNNKLLDKSYGNDEAKQEAVRVNQEKGYVEIVKIEKNTNSKNNLEELDDSEIQNENNNSEFDKASFNYMLNVIEHILERGYELHDIAILVRTNKEEKKYVNFLIEHGKYNFISNESLDVVKNENINLIVNCLRFIYTTKDKLLAAEINSLNLNLKTKQNKLNTPNNAKLSDELEQTKYKQSLLLSYYNLKELIFGNYQDAYFNKFEDIITEYLLNESNNVLTFLDWWDEKSKTKKWSISIPSTKHAIRIMSIHKSKGLQFPFVIIPNCNWNKKIKNNTSNWLETKQSKFNSYEYLPIDYEDILNFSDFSDEYNDEMELNYIDNINLLYVAFTRAENELYLCIPKKGKSNEIQEEVVNILDSMVQQNQLEFVDDKYYYGERLPQSNNSETNYFEKKTDVQNITTNRNIIWLPNLKSADSFEQIYGNWLHEAMSKIKSNNAIDEVLDRMKVEIKDQRFRKCLPDLKIAIEHFFELIDQIESGNKNFKVCNEISMLNNEGHVLRPDRILIDEQHAIVIDFKTGAPKSTHSTQISSYCDTLKSMGFNTVEGYLLYLDQNEPCLVVN